MRILVLAGLASIVSHALALHQSSDLSRRFASGQGSSGRPSQGQETGSDESDSDSGSNSLRPDQPGSSAQHAGLGSRPATPLDETAEWKKHFGNMKEVQGRQLQKVLGNALMKEKGDISGGMQTTPGKTRDRDLRKDIRQIQEALPKAGDVKGASGGALEGLARLLETGGMTPQNRDQYVQKQQRLMNDLRRARGDSEMNYGKYNQEDKTKTRLQKILENRQKEPKTPGLPPKSTSELARNVPKKTDFQLRVEQVRKEAQLREGVEPDPPKGLKKTPDRKAGLTVEQLRKVSQKAQKEPQEGQPGHGSPNPTESEGRRGTEQASSRPQEPPEGSGEALEAQKEKKKLKKQRQKENKRKQQEEREPPPGPQRTMTRRSAARAKKRARAPGRTRAI